MAFFEPRINPDTAPFWEGCKAHQLRIQKCRKCGRLRWPAAYLCPDCLSEEAEYVTLPPAGTLYSYIVMHRAFHPSLEDKTPYIVATVDLTEDIRILANIFDCPPESLHCGDAVEIGFLDSDTISTPVAHVIKPDRTYNERLIL